jgi:hypothetical protein
MSIVHISDQSNRILLNSKPHIPWITRWQSGLDCANANFRRQGQTLRAVAQMLLVRLQCLALARH